MNNFKEIFNDFVKSFIIKNRQERILSFQKKEKNWEKIINEFHTSFNFKKNVIVSIKPIEQYSEIIYMRMKEMGATDECYSLLDYFDGNEYKYSLSDKLDNTVGFLVETILYCPKSKIGYYEGGHAKDRYILKYK